MPKLLALLSNPDDEVKLRMDREMKEILGRISPQVMHDFYYRQVPAVTIDELPGLLISEQPELLHFSGHGGKKELVFEDKMGNKTEVSHEALADIFSVTGPLFVCVLLNACSSLELAKMIAAYVPFVIGFPDNIEDEAASAFSQCFYETLSLGQPVPDAFKLAKAVLKSKQIDESRLPGLLSNANVAAISPIIFRRPVIKAKFEVDKLGKPKHNGKTHDFRLWIDHIPFSASYAVLEAIDSTIEESERFEVMSDFKAGSFTNWDVAGNIIIRCWFWMGEKRYGIGIESTLAECLRNHYTGQVPAKCQKAYDYITNN